MIGGGTGSTVLHIACWRSHVDLVQWLVEHVRRSRGQAMETYVNCRDTDERSHAINGSCTNTYWNIESSN